MTTDGDPGRDSLAELTPAELGALAALIRLVVRSNTEFTDEERDQVGRIADEAGTDAFWKLMNEAAEADAGPDEVLQQAAADVTASDARELIYGALYELSIQDSIDIGENDLLDRLAATWQLDIKDVPPG